MCAARVEAVVGSSGAGKTAALIDAARTLLGSGAPAGELLVVTPGADAALELRLRLEAELCAPDVPRVVGLAELLWELAGKPRVLAGAERTVLLADMRARGFSGAQVSHALAEAQAAWGVGAWPRASDACLTSLLQALEERRATLPEALVALAARALAGDPAVQDASEPHALAGHILADDAQALSPAALALLASAARTSLFLAGDPTAPNALFDAAADPQAFLALVGEQACRALPDPAGKPAYIHGQAVKWADASEELAGVCALADHALDHDEARGPLVVCANNPGWLRSHARALQAAGMKVLGPSCLHPLACDARDARAAQALRAFAALGLLADAASPSCWRAWCALGYADFASVAWAQLEAHARAAGAQPVDVLRGLPKATAAGEEPFAGSAQLAARVREAEALFAACSKQRGAALLDTLDPRHTPAFRQLVGFVDDRVSTLGAEGLFQLACARLAGPSLGMHVWDVRADEAVANVHPVPADAARRVFACPVEALLGLHPRTLVVVGANAGLAQEERFAHALTVGADRLVVSYVQRMPQDAADKLGAFYRRTRHQDGQPMALLGACEALTSLGQQVPATMSGQQFCATVLGVRP